MPENSVFDGPIANLLSVMCILLEVLSPARVKGGGSLNDFKFSTFVGRFPSDRLVSMAVKGLKSVSFLTLCMFKSPFRTLEVNFVSGGVLKKNCT